jgi:hypothetical protein
VAITIVRVSSHNTDYQSEEGHRALGKLYFGCGSPSEPQIVYGHRFPQQEELFHIGSGTYRRALSPVRGASWLQHVGDRDVEVLVLEVHQCPARARLREAELIALHQPLTNHHHKTGPHRQVLAGYNKQGLRCACGATDCYGAEVSGRL